MSELLYGVIAAVGAYMLLKGGDTVEAIVPVVPVNVTPALPVVPVPVQNANVPSPSVIIPTQVPIPPVVAPLIYSKTVMDGQGVIWGLVAPLPYDIYQNNVLMPGQAADIRTVSGRVQVKGIDPVTAFEDGSWWEWNGNIWVRVGNVSVSPTASIPLPTSTVFKSVTDIMGVRWSLEGAISPYTIMRNGIHAGNGFASDVRLVSGQAQVLGEDNGWWAWSGVTWVPAVTAPVSVVTQSGSVTIAMNVLGNPSIGPWGVQILPNVADPYVTEVYLNGVFHHREDFDPRCLTEFGEQCTTFAYPPGNYVVEARVIKGGVEVGRRAITVIGG